MLLRWRNIGVNNFLWKVAYIQYQDLNQKLESEDKGQHSQHDCPGSCSHLGLN